MKVHNDLKELLEDFSQFINPEIEFIPKNELDEMLSTYLSSNSLALGKPEPLAKNKQTKQFCEWCGDKLTHKVETDINSEKICRSRLCPAK